jgi:sugar fermentation stimulation protein A
LIPGVLIRRYKRFLADVTLADGTTVTAHCPNSGSMLGCADPGRPVYLSQHDNPRRKLKYTWELIHMPTSLVGVNTLIPNRLVAETVSASGIPELGGYDTLRREVSVAPGSRLDLMLSNGDSECCYVEVKNCTLVDNGWASFPDAVTTRGLKHLNELIRLVKEGNRCVMFFLIQRMDARCFKPADHIDPAYGNGLRAAVAAGVEVLVYDTAIDLDGIQINHPIPWEL